MNKEDLLIKPGFGCQLFHLDQTEREIQAILGKPNRRIWTFRDSYFYIYRKKGIDLDFGKRGGRLKVIFFYLDGFSGHKGANVVTAKDIRLGDAESKVLQCYGNPDQQGNCSLSKQSLSSWYYYCEGIQFDFNKDKKVCVISISNKHNLT